MSSGSYDPDTLEIRWATPYAQAHEWAHVEQRVRRTLAWRWRDRWTGRPLLERVANLAVECEAAWLACREMRACGIWTEEDAQEARAGLLSYLLSLLSKRLLKLILPTVCDSQTAADETRNIDTRL